MIKYILLNQHFDVAKMQQEVNQLQQIFWKNHYNTNDYQGDWKILPLRSIGGKLDHIISLQTDNLSESIQYKNTQLLKNCTYIKSVIDFFECKKLSVRLMNLKAGAFIKEHSDFDLCFEDGEVRIHIPVQTNNAVEFFVQGEQIPMLEGECWYLNLSLKHKVNNFGSTDRIHLVIDCKVNDWIENLFLNNIVKIKNVDITESKNIRETKSKQDFSNREKIKIIEQLRLMNTPTSNQLANNMEAEM